MIEFGTGGWRAKIGEDFTKENVQKIAKAVSYLAVEHAKLANVINPIVIGYDNRFLSEEASKWIAETVSNYGIQVQIFPTSVATPILMHEVKKYDLDFGLMVTASHNPYNYNGIKVIVREGRDAPKEVTGRIANLCNNHSELKIEPLSGMKNRTPILKLNERYLADYYRSIADILDIEKIKKYKKKFLFNPMHGSATEDFADIATALNLNWSIINANVDPYFDYQLPAPNKDTLDSMKLEMSRGKKYAFGIAFDGDGDRLGVLDEDGNYIDMNKLLCMFYWYLKEYRHEQGGVVKNCVTTLVLDKIAKHYNEACYDVPVGFKWVSSAMSEHNALIGGESSGGLTMRGHIYGKDSIFSSLLLIEMLSVTKKSIKEISEYIDKTFGKFEFYENSMTYLHSNRDKVNEFIYDLPNLLTEKAIVDTRDGTKLTFEDGTWISIRFSGTEPIVRIMAEYHQSDNNFKNMIQNIETKLKGVC